LIFSMYSFSVAKPIPSLGGKKMRYKPLIPLRILGPGGHCSRLFSVDSSADDIVMGISEAAILGIDLTNAPRITARGVGGQVSSVSFASVILELTDNIATCRWRAVIGFTHAFMQFPLFGFAGGLEFFRTTVDGFRHEVEMIAQPNLPSTQASAP
jgi:hypothetical protein